jgi:SAM-dependent methyltransferase
VHELCTRLPAPVGSLDPDLEAFQTAFVEPDSGVSWDEQVYSEGSYESRIWDLQKPFVENVFQERLKRGRPLRFLDFACGTGRVLLALNHYADEATGLDISAAMLDQAREKTSGVRLVRADIVRQPNVLVEQFDVITAFRFFLNAPSQLRRQVMEALSARLRDDHSVLVFNIHGNASSVVGIWRHLRGRRRPAGAESLSLSEIRRLVAGAGLRIEDWRGYGVTPRRLNRGILAPFMHFVDRMAVLCPPLWFLSRDLIFVCRASRPFVERAAGRETPTGGRGKEVPRTSPAELPNGGAQA